MDLRDLVRYDERMTPLIAVKAQKALDQKAAFLASSLALPLASEVKDADYHLVLTPERLELVKLGSKMKPLYADFVRGKAAYRQQHLKQEPLAKAVGIKGSYRPTVIDATAGLGQDALILAGLGSRVTMLERSPIVAALLQNGLERAAPILGDVINRLTLIQTEAQIYLETLTEHSFPDVVYLDPMYPRTGKSAAKQKAMQFFREVLGDDKDAAEVLVIAKKVAKKRVVVKRPTKAAPLGNEKPSAVISGRTTRFDVYV